jgi:hypothetical protein
VGNSERERSAWLSLSSPEGGGTHLRITQPAYGSPAVTGVYVHGPDITSTVLQAAGLSVSRLRTVFDVIGADIGTLETVIKFGAYGAPVADGSDQRVADLEDHAASGPPELRIIESASRKPLSRPDGTDPEGFYRRVAEAYREYAMKTRAPAAGIARESGVPVRTVHGWIHEARRRGFLPPGRKAR